MPEVNPDHFLIRDGLAGGLIEGPVLCKIDFIVVHYYHYYFLCVCAQIVWALFCIARLKGSFVVLGFFFLFHFVFLQNSLLL